MTDELIDKFYKIFDNGIVRQIKKLDVDCKKAELIRCSVTNNRRRKTLPRPYVIEAFKDYFDEDKKLDHYKEVKRLMYAAMTF
ncbi:hypothetical protein B8V60_02160 [Streptococcus agalactiae]|uniref:hypothetical protein n=1 Tax=Streptococcus agalactiae TaxID=1311 RepID=UPI001374C126|nr:hypothetical protein [Streptococcus agalactiae]KAF1244309.1 hypothetical protein B8V60_02160 [Streptococcus agalactiae]